MNTKDRILLFVQSKGLTKPEFYRLAKIKRGLLDSDKMDMVVSDRHLAALVAAFPDVNLEWIVTGNGDMMKPSPIQLPTDVVSIERYEAKVEECIRLRIELENIK